eukprot:TRINITY_DN16033_c0_g1_i1.p1 TRINITY_DN16033_c0_g1~~TRINITY_DN16033_c0_g1_i1.p1  ORF type:complete len:148 (+),score=28.89 TRINITY_DN16033_c0_g1_i1:149-592(+)
MAAPHSQRSGSASQRSMNGDVIPSVRSEQGGMQHSASEPMLTGGALDPAGANSSTPGINAFVTQGPKVVYLRRNQTYGSFYINKDPRLIPLDKANYRTPNAPQDFSRHLGMCGFHRDRSLADMKNQEVRPGRGLHNNYNRQNWTVRP